MHAVSRIIEELVSIGSPSGYTEEVISHVEKRLTAAGITCRTTNKGALIACNHESPELALAAHVDTLGAMVSGLLDSGRLRIARLGSWPLNSFEGEYLTLVTHSGDRHRGTLLLDNPAAHVNPKIGETKRSLSNMHVRLDVEAESVEHLRDLGVEIGDVILFDPRFEHTDSGFVRSRFLDDKAGSACLIHICESLRERLSELPVAFFFSNFEEVGHGAAAGLPSSLTELLAVDMGVVGGDTGGDEYHVSICAKDSGGPYDYRLRKELVELARKHEIAHKVDVFPYYRSDGTTALSAGWELRVGLVGPGINASHGVERTHEKALQATCDLLSALVRERYL